MELKEKEKILKEKPEWTPFRIEIEQAIKENHLKIMPLNITRWEKIEKEIVHFFTGNSAGFTWMWERSILKKFDCYAKEIQDFTTLEDILKNNLAQNELLWLFLEDSIHCQSKYWGYIGEISDILRLLGELPLTDFYIVSKKPKWLVGQNHEDILFGYGEIAGKLGKYSKKNYEDKMGLLIYEIKVIKLI